MVGVALGKGVALAVGVGVAVSVGVGVCVVVGVELGDGVEKGCAVAVELCFSGVAIFSDAGTYHILNRVLVRDVFAAALEPLDDVERFLCGIQEIFIITLHRSEWANDRIR